MLHLLTRIKQPAWAKKLAVVNSNGTSITYGELLGRSTQLASLMRNCNIKEPTIACFHKASSGYVETMLATWMIGKRFLPLCTTHPEAELRYFIEDSKAGVIVYSSQESCSKHSYDALPKLGIPLVDSGGLQIATPVGKILPQSSTAAFTAPELGSDALILYTSGTTGKPKGVVHSHIGVTCMISGLVDSWMYASDDRILHFLPLHHLHGVLNKLLCVLYAGGGVEFLSSAQPQEIWSRLSTEKVGGQSKINLFMAVPTVYSRMIEFADDALNGKDAEKRAMVQRALEAVKANMRLMACGSAALPDTVMNTWRNLTGHVLLERYGMTEGGMLLSNDYMPVSNRTPGHVGRPLPFVTVRLVDDKEKEIAHSNSAKFPKSGGDETELPGELRVKGPTVFREYLNRPDAYRESFDAEGWFKTGDIAVRKPNGMYAILGRNSTDIIKARGYKLSALEIERELLACELVKEVAVLGRPHSVDGEYVAAVVVVQQQSLSKQQQSQEALVAQLKSFLKSRLANYKTPSRYFFVAQLPRNALGKVNKKTLFKDLNLTD